MATIRFGTIQAIVTDSQKKTITKFREAGYKPAYDLLSKTWKPKGLFYMRGTKDDVVFIDSEGRHHKPR